LVAGKSQHREIVIVVMERTQTCVLRREASSAGDVDDQTELALESIEGDSVAFDRVHFELVEA